LSSRVAAVALRVSVVVAVLVDLELAQAFR
jgi:hypothetical protein